MDYEKKYKEALNWMRDVYPTLEGAAKEDAEHYFPELKESEDERIRKALIEAIRHNYVLTGSINHIPTKDILAWLEKQCDKGTNGNNEEIPFSEQKPAEWSKEDEAHIDSLLKRLEGICKPGAAFISTRCAISEDKDWLKSLKDRYTWKPSDEQIEALDSATENCAYSEYQDCLRELIGQLKKLRED